MTEHQERIEYLLEALKEARIYAGAEFEACCNENEYSRAIYFSGFRDVLATYIRLLEDYKDVFQSDDRCPVCGKKTSEGKNGGKIYFDCVNNMNCESCEYYGSHHEVCNYCYKCSLWTEKEPTGNC